MRPGRIVSTPTNEATSLSTGEEKTSAAVPNWRTFPPISTAMRSPSRRASVRSCVTKTVATRLVVRTASRSSIRDSRVGASSELNGSSKSKISGSSTIALARLVRWASPPESVRAERRRSPPMPKRAVHSSTRRCRSLAGTPRRESPERTLPSTLVSRSSGS